MLALGKNGTPTHTHTKGFLKIEYFCGSRIVPGIAPIYLHTLLLQSVNAP